MALMRWRWICGPLLAAAVVVLVTLPPGIPSQRGLLSFFGLAYSQWQRDPGAAHRAAVEEAVGRQRSRLREELLADSILAATRGPRVVRSSDGAVTVAYEAPLSADSARAWLRAAVAELNLYPKPQGRGVPIVVALLSNPGRRFDAREQYFESTVNWVHQAATGGHACIVTLNLARGQRTWWSSASLVVRDPAVGPVGRFLDVCALEGRFGPPGAAVERWAESRPFWYWRAALLATRLSEARRSVRKEDAARLSEYTYWYGQVSWVVVGCLGGSEGLCARTAGLGPAGEFGEGYYLERRLILGHLLATGTADQFATFWRSPLAPRDALQQAYGRPAAWLALAAFRHWYSAPPATPRAEPQLMLAGLAWAGAALALALVAGRRWTTEI